MFDIFCYPAHDKIRREWEAEEHDHHILREAWNSERKAMAAEREEWRKERADHENWKHREEEGKRSLIVWENLTPSNKCLRYGTREYSATLANVPIGLDPLKECWKKSIDIHGRQVLPSRCDTQVCVVFFKSALSYPSILKHPFPSRFREYAELSRATGLLISMKHHVLRGGTVITTRYSLIYLYIFQLFQPLTINVGLRRTRDSCSSSYYLFCTGNNDVLQRYESGLVNLQSGDDWQEMCATTPAHVQGKDFDGPTSCAIWVR